MSSQGSLNLKITASESSSNDFANPSWAANITHALNFTDGTAANQFDLVWFDERAVATASNDDIDLSGALSTALGTSFVAAEGVMIAIVNAPISGTANTTNLTIGNGTNAWEGWVSSAGTVGPIGPGGFFMIGSPDATGLGTITAATADILRVANSAGATATFQIAIYARTA